MNCRCLVLLAVVLLATLVLAEGEIWEEDEKEVLIRSERGAKNSKEPCRYEKGPWSECDQKSNMRARQLSLKKKPDGTSNPNCEETKTIQKKCKKACRYEKGTWSTCNAQNEMVRTDTLKEKSDPSCEQKRITTKKCKNKAGRANKVSKEYIIMKTYVMVCLTLLMLEATYTVQSTDVGDIPKRVSSVISSAE